ncbi:hypothetical protein ACFWGN_17910 [Oerskovia sp. NPDC060338]|uniref:hypothetical protein n=1 Tax=Oerskovia sp. NPDC060338 TaxID=3347100 RepID=UPI0036611C00
MADTESEAAAKELIAKGLTLLCESSNPDQDGLYVQGWIIAAEWTSIELERTQRAGVITFCPEGQMITVSRGLGDYIDDKYRIAPTMPAAGDE